MTAPGLSRGVRLLWDPVRERHALVYPEGALLLDPVAADIVRACDGRRDAAGIVAVLARDYSGVAEADVGQFLADLTTRRLLVTAGRPAHAEVVAGSPAAAVPHPLPTGLLAELTYRCPLRCTYCSNPIELAAYRAELDTGQWHDLLEQARVAGVLQVHLSGGEPLLRPDLPAVVAHARRLGLYTNLVTSGVPLTAETLTALVDAGLDHLQLSVQDAERADADLVAGARVHDRKLAAAELIRGSGLPLTVNVVLHAGNLARLTAIAELAVALGAERLELAHTQFYGWGLRNRATLLPSPAQVDAAGVAVAEVHRRFGDTVEVVYVEPDYHTGRAKPCMNGWGSRQLVVAPNGDVLPCLAAAQLPGFPIPSVRNDRLIDIWNDAPAFNAFRGTAWMAEPCRSCALREVDFGGCRCQAFQLTGDPAATDPACRFSPRHEDVAGIAAGAGTRARPEPVPRRPR
ncbi:pyrroloquinoline quinone biosynthesis protein PqqE [Dactylosporangium sp. NPDC005555]|uniref:pyrroloquinoline quinone biosynthesis protein PqqE n=1 Tax=Dactylosporangium sp. NPDC005555 TaxID=3154889 RepID=UPI0033A9394A